MNCGQQLSVQWPNAGPSHRISRSAERTGSVRTALAARYRWGQADLERMVEDLMTVAVDGPHATHYGGTLLTFPELGAVGVVETIRVVDGQQRLTTVSILLACVADELEGEGPCGDWTAEVIRNDRLTNPGNRRVLSPGVVKHALDAIGGCPISRHPDLLNGRLAPHV